MKHHIYYISGLGADGRAFRELQIEAASHTHLGYFDPEKGETIKSYALKMAEKIKHEENVALVGLSFGGIMAQEIAAICKVNKIVLISTVKKRSELPWSIKIGSVVPLHRIPISMDIRMRTMKYWGKYFGLHSQAAAAFFAEMMRKHSNRYMKWAINEIVTWQEPTIDIPFLHLHGTADMVFPFRRINAPVKIQGGHHSMVFTHAELISRSINDFLQ